ncbi:hypothetical protein [Rhodopirellula sallentina]|uniref:Uncharacterized protein n=1 Tax=Rhodopirellula sallentina SM41 TaxID=1263870 RepID=M5U276_9BACT|nr:hypothetical protein [Rhodopirellula sallentina]EMI51956.1 hypothetical protein RSSM_06589 [Rhodopirellula sallentina SM41]
MSESTPSPADTQPPQDDADRHQVVRSLFNQAVALEDTERRWFLHALEDRDLAADVERLLESSACCGTFRDKNSSCDGS